MTEAGVPLNNANVLLYWRPSGLLCGRTSTNANGVYTFSGLVAASNNYVVVLQDKEGGTVYNDVIRSLLTPG
jgi:hypothetical protein